MQHIIYTIITSAMQEGNVFGLVIWSVTLSVYLSVGLPDPLTPHDALKHHFKSLKQT